MKTLQEQLDAAGLHVFGCCERLSAYGPDLLQTSQLLQDFTPAEADILGASMLLVRAEPGQVMIREGEAGDWMMLVLKGTVDVTKRLELPADADADAGAEAAVSRVAVVRAGAAVGDMSMLDSEPRYATCTAIEAVEAGVWGRHEIALLIRDHPGVGAKLLVKITQMMAQRLRNTSNQLVRILRKQAAAAAETPAR
ncbi:Crp/Fnr family transcriptional regulator [Polaromonas sp. JS666]|uniref:Crp/Fnr family transcriptional regulator n=1 Tax=Polaromonas sp. (strain JS666 / ATCC BAA-500) TaxID=296591 RepID=UPI0008836868|nr:cyclic nucleotide-binding domain-containing protein [Polaromonas sp. JS666]SDN62083.1 Cyclic nucleotide-binding domain-containing protein [Polaromonas sp. JS666]